jgi:putative transposase
MAGKRDKPEEIVSKLRQVEVLQGQGATIAEAVRQIAVLRRTVIERQPRAQAEIRDLLIQYYRLGVLTKSEDQALNDLGLRSLMPAECFGDDPFARYSACGIEGRAISE